MYTLNNVDRADDKTYHF